MRIRGVVSLAMVGFASLGLTSAMAAQKKDRKTITREEIMESAQKDGDLYQAIRSIRPHFLQKPRGQRSMDVAMSSGGSSAGAQGAMRVGSGVAPEPTVYVNGTKLGELNLLKSILAADVFEVKYLDPVKAQDEYGPDHNGGAIIVTLVKGIKDKP